MNIFDYRKHILVGIAGYVCILMIQRPDIHIALRGLIWILITSILADLDQLQSKIGQLLFDGPTKLTMFIYNLFRWIVSLSGAGYYYHTLHKTWSQMGRLEVSMLVVVFLTFLVVLEPNENFIKRRVAEMMGLVLMALGFVQWDILLLIQGALILTYTIAGHRSFVSHSLASFGLLVVVLSQADPEILWYGVVGYGLHLLCDHVFDTDPCPLFQPFDLLIKMALRMMKGGGSKLKATQVRDLQLLTINILLVYIYVS